jgi:hypothetical protein
MPEVNWLVYMSYGISVPEKLSIGTQGCGPCLGIIIRSNKRVICVHMSCDVVVIPSRNEAKQPEYFRLQSQIANYTLKLWQNARIPPQGVELYMTAGGPDESTRAMHAATNIFFGKNEPLGSSNGIYWDGAKHQLLEGGMFGEELTKNQGESEGSDNSGKGPFNIRRDGSLPEGVMILEKG